MEKLLDLFNTLWFERGLLVERLESSTESLSARNEAGSELDRPALKISHVRSSSSDHLNLILLSGAESPKSVLRQTPKLQTVLSGKEVGVFGELVAADEMKVERRRKRRWRRKSGGSKSLTELEFEEMRGFMDLGFVFSDEDHKDSSLLSMTPGLHRYGHHHHNGEEDEVSDDNLNGLSRPYLSEAWRCGRKEMKLLRVSLGITNEAETKKQIKFWAHSVASALR